MLLIVGSAQHYTGLKPFLHLFNCALGVIIIWLGLSVCLSQLLHFVVNETRMPPDTASLLFKCGPQYFKFLLECLLRLICLLVVDCQHFLELYQRVEGLMMLFSAAYGIPDL